MMSKHLKLAVIVGAAIGAASCGIESLETNQTSQEVLTTNLSAYVSGDNIVVNFTGMQGAPSDWISIARPSDSAESYFAWKYTGGGTSGSVTFVAPDLPAGTYEARGFYDWYNTQSYTIQQRSAPFTVSGGGASLSPSATFYPLGTPVVINYSGFSGSTTDWISIHKPGDPDTSYIAYQYTGGGTSGSKTFTGLPTGTWEARYHANWNGTHSYISLATSSQFTIGGSPTIKTDQNVYGASQQITVTYTNLPGNTLDYVAVSASGSPASSTIQRFYTSGQVNGSQVFSPLPAGSYEARAYENDSTTIIAMSTFTVTSTSLTTDQSFYTSTQPVTVTFSGMPGGAQDWISISTVNSPDTSYVQWAYTGGATSGTLVFNNLPTGTYEARAHYNNSYTTSARSASFSVGQACTPPAVPPVVSGISSGDLAIAATAAEATAALSVPLSSSILFTTIRESEPSPQHGNALCELIATGIHCKRIRSGTDSPSSTGALNVHWTVVTFSSGVTVQRGLNNTFTTNPMNVTINAVDLNSSFVLLGGSYVGGTGWGNNEFTRARLTSTTNLEIAHSSPGSQVAWQVVTMSGATVTRGMTSLSTNVIAQTVTIPETPSGSMLLASYTTDNPSGIAAAALMLRSHLASATSLSFQRNLGGSNLSVAWEVIQLPFATRLGEASFAAGVASATVSVPGVSAASSVALSSSQAILGQSGGATSYSGTDLDLVGEAAFTLSAGTDSLLLQRQSTTAAASLPWTIIDFAHTCAGT